MPVVRFNGTKLDPATIKALVSGTLVNGSKPSVWWNRQSIDFRNSFMDVMRESARNGESLTQAITRVVGGTVDGVQYPGIMKTTKAKAGALAATAQNAVANEAALKSFQANNDVIKAVTQLSTLDNKTSDICIAYSGQTWDINTLAPVAGSTLPFNGGPPRHFNCRSRLRPVTMSFRELGLDADEIPAGTRASMDGQVPADITFNQFLKGKPKSFADDLLGPKRAQLWRDGEINLTQLVDMRGNPLTVEQLKARLGMPPSKPAFNPATNRTPPAPKPQVKMVDSFLKNDDDTFIKIAQTEYDEIRSGAKRLVAAAEDADDLVTSQIKSLADDVGAKFPDASIVKDGPLVDEGSLHWRMKDVDSTSRKIQTYARDRNLTFTEAADQISDSLRYTFLVDEANYVKAVRETMERFAELGYKNGKFDAAWLKRPDYRGLNINMVTPEGVKMELQFHTARSFHVKDKLNHVLYEEFRTLSKAKQLGPEGQAIQAEMLANAKTIPMPPNIEFLDEMAKIYNKPNPAAQAKILDDAAKEVAARTSFAETVAFNNEIAAALKDGNYLLARKTILDAGDVVPDAAKKSATQRIAETRKESVKKADSLIAEKKFADIKTENNFNGAYIDLVEEMDAKNIDKAVRIEVTDKLKTLKAQKLEEFTTEDVLSFQVQGNFKEALSTAAKIENPSPEFQKMVAQVKTDQITSVEKAVRLSLENGKSDDAIKTLLAYGDTKDAPKLQALHKEIQTGTKVANDKVTVIENTIVKDFDEFSAVVKKEINADDVPQWVRNRILNDPDFAIAEENAKWVVQVKNIEKQLVEGKIDDALSAIKGVPDTIYNKKSLQESIEAAKKKKDDLVKIQFPKKVEDIAVKEYGFGLSDLELLPMSVEDLGIMFDGVITEQFKINLRKQLGAARVQLREHMDKVTALNKASKGVDEITAYANNLSEKIRTHPEFQKTIKKATAQAKKKASAARKEVLDTLIKGGDIDADDILLYGDSVLKEAMKDVNKKLGKAQLQAKRVEVKSKLAAAKKNDVSIAEFTADLTKYDEEVVALLNDTDMTKLKDAVKFFKNDGAGSSAAKQKMLQILNGKSAKQTRAIKEYVHKRTNPKTLPSGSNFDAKVAEIVTKHVNNVDRAVIRAHIDAMTKGADASTKMLFEQTVFTRAGVKNFDELGKLVKPDQGSVVEKIREALKIDDPGNAPIPAHSAAEQMKAAKVWLNSKSLNDVDFREQSLRTSKQRVANGKGQIKEGDRIFGENSWGITPDEWDDWAKNVAPTLNEWDVALINQYTGGMAGRINAGLYNGGMELDYTAGARALNSALDKMPKHTGTVYRGTSSRSGWTADYIDARYEIGKTVTERGFGSSATQTAAQFSGNLKFIIKTKGKSGAIIGHIGGYGTKEMEVLFKAGTKFKVIKKQRSGSGIKVWMEEVG